MTCIFNESTTRKGNSNNDCWVVREREEGREKGSASEREKIFTPKALESLETKEKFAFYLTCISLLPIRPSPYAALLDK